MNKENQLRLKQEDEELINSLREGQDEMFPLILERYKGLVKTEAKKLFIQGGDHEDLIQEGMIGLMKAVNDYKIGGGASFHTFAKICVSRQIYTAVEAAARKKHQPLNSYISINQDETQGQYEEINVSAYTSSLNEDPEAIFLGKENQEYFTSELMKKLSEFEKSVLLHHLMGMDYKEISTELGKESKTIDNALQRIKNKAKIVLSKA